MLKLVLVFTSLILVIPCQAKTIYVDANAPGVNNGQDWTNAYKYLQDALADAGSAAKPVEICVAQGICKPDQSSADPNGSGDRYATFQLINGVTLKGGYAGFGEPEPNERDIEAYETILSGDLNDDDGPNFVNMAENSIHVVTGSSTEPNAVLDGFTISGGRGSGMYNYCGSPALANCIVRDNSGSGMYNTHFSDPAVTNCKFSLNQAGENGGAMCNENSNPVVTGCTFVANSIMLFALGFGGAVYNEGCSPTFDYCTFRENLSERGGGGMYNRESSPILTNCTFERNWSGLFGGGLDTVSESSNPIVIGCTFIGNSANYSGGGTSNGTSGLTLINCLFVSNSAANGGGGMYSHAGKNIKVSNCTFYRNEAPNGNMLTCSHESNVQFTNCVIWDGGNEIWNPLGSIITLTYSDVCGGQISAYDPCESMIWGEGNIVADPCFADANNGDYHLKSQAGRWDPNSESWVLDDATSPCIDAGNPMSPIGPEPFPNGGRINMGAYGGTAEASKSYFGRPVCQTIVAGDINGDCEVNFKDFALMALHWLECIGPNQGRRHLVEDDTEDSYSCEGNFDVSYPCSNAVDEDWNNYALPADGGAASCIYENYIIPSGIAMAEFTIKYRQTAAVTPGLCTNVTDYWDGSTWKELNCTALTNQISTLTVRIPYDALSRSTLQLRTRIWKSLDIPGSGSGMYYEGKVIWSFLPVCQNIVAGDVNGD